MNSHLGSVSIEAVEGHTERRILVVVPLRQALQPKFATPSPRQLPTNHDHDGGVKPIREYQCDQPSSLALRPLQLFQEKDQNRNTKQELMLDWSFHISGITSWPSEDSPRFAAEYLKKGRQVYVEGRLRTREFEAKSNGGKGQRTEIVASRVQFLGPAGDRPAASAVEEPPIPAEADVPF
jgi:hypothetical protein